MKLENVFINELVENSETVTIFLTNGVKLNGVITRNSEDCLTLTRDGSTQLVFKHAIGTILPV